MRRNRPDRTGRDGADRVREEKRLSACQTCRLRSQMKWKSNDQKLFDLWQFISTHFSSLSQRYCFQMTAGLRVVIQTEKKKSSNFCDPMHANADRDWWSVRGAGWEVRRHINEAERKSFGQAKAQQLKVNQFSPLAGWLGLRLWHEKEIWKNNSVLGYKR